MKVYPINATFHRVFYLKWKSLGTTAAKAHKRPGIPTPFSRLETPAVSNGDGIESTWNLDPL
jgi:hypothetical protein